MASVAGLSLYPYLTYAADELIRCGLLVDDAFFYGVIGQNVLSKRLTTFDGVQSTNGFQPLWMLIHLLEQRLLPSVEPVALIARTSWAVYVLFAFALTAHICTLAKSLRKCGVFLVPAVLLLLHPGFHRLAVMGLEVPLALLLVVACMIIVERMSGGPSRSSARFDLECLLGGAAAGLTFLSRTDLFWCVLLMLAFSARVSRAERRRVRAIAMVALPAIAIVVPYLAWNYAQFGALMPISGRVKQFYMDVSYPTLAEYLRSNEWLGLIHATALSSGLVSLLGWTRFASALAVIGLAGTSAAVIIAWRRGVLSSSEKFLTLLVVTHATYMHLVYRELRPYSSYYFSVAIMWLALSLGRLLVTNMGVARGQQEPIQRAEAFAPICVVVLVAALCLNSWRQNSPRTNPVWESRVRMAGDIRTSTDPAETIAAFWPGMLSYVSKRSVIPLDGIVGSARFFDGYVRSGHQLEYAQARGVKYVAVFLDEPVESLLARREPPKVDWPKLGTLLIWQRRSQIKRVVASEPLASGGGWYLLEFTATPLASEG